MGIAIALHRGSRSWKILRAAVLGSITAGLGTLGPAGAVFLVTGDASRGPWPYIGVGVVSLALVAIASLLARRLTSLDRHAIRVGYLVGVAAFVLLLLDPWGGGWRDASAYYSVGLVDPYQLSYAVGGVRYSPVFFQVVEPLRGLTWPTFLLLWTGIQLAALRIVAGPLAAVLLLVPVVALEAHYTNINLLLALAITWGFRWPALWSLVLVTKITPGVGLVWFAVRREWRNLAIALGVTTAVVLVSIAISPGLWASWLGALASTASAGDGVSDILLLPLRLLLAVLVVGLGGITDRPWTVPLGAVIAMPVLWPATLAVLVAIVPLVRRSSPIGNWRAVDWALKGTDRRDGNASRAPTPEH